MSRNRSEKRPWLAAALALLYPGLGHAYLREWLRALLWFALVLTTTALALPAAAVPESGFSLEAVVSASQALPTEASLVIFLLSVLNIVDAYRLARQRNQWAETETGSEDDGHCPHCGRETDTEFEFCQWCGEPIDAASS